VWATAFYAGLRRGELMALDWENIDLSASTINVTRSYDPRSRCFVSPKSRAGSRRVPIAAVLREHLISHRLRSGRSSGLVFGPDGTQVFSYSAMRDRASRAWASTCLCGHHAEEHDDAACDSFQHLQRIGLHEAPSHLRLAHDRGEGQRQGPERVHGALRHLDNPRPVRPPLPGNEQEATELLDAYLAVR